MSLRTQALIAITVIVTLIMVAEYVGAAIVLKEGFERVEREAVEQSVMTFEGHMPFEVAVVAEAFNIRQGP